jgi:hypothetical protein
MPDDLEQEDNLTRELFSGRTPAADSSQFPAADCAQDRANHDNTDLAEPSDLRSVNEEANTRDESTTNPENQVSRLEEASGD